jgi:hypothetical protein
VANAVAQKDLYRDTGIGDLRICDIHDRSGNPVRQFVRMRRIDFFKHTASSFHQKAPEGNPSEARFFMI